MKRYLSLLPALMLAVFAVYGQWSDDFSDGNLRHDPQWIGDTIKYEVSGGMLHLNDTTSSPAGPTYVWTSSNVAYNASWSFLVKFDFRPSSKNYAKIYLMSSKSDIDSSLSGYYLRVGYTKYDICLFRQENENLTLLADGRDKMLYGTTSLSKARIKVTRSVRGLWEVYCDSTGGENYKFVSKAVDSTLRSSSFFGFGSYYTSTRAKKVWVDDISVTGSIYPQAISASVTVSPSVDPTITPVSPTITSATSTVTPATSTETSASSCVSPSVDPTVTAASSTVTPVTSTVTLVSTTVTSVSTTVTSSSTTVSPVSTTVTSVTPNVPSTSTLTTTPKITTDVKAIADSSFLFDLVFNELMLDPSPVVDLPEGEYCELYNRTTRSLSLNGWKLSVGNTVYKFPNMTIQAAQYLIITSKADTAKFRSFGKTLGLFSSATALNNTGQYLRLFNSKGELIDYLEYIDEWYADDFKATGGWSIEQIDVDNPCGGKVNWKASISKRGGTPGAANSVADENPDTSLPSVKRVNVANDTILEVYFNETLDTVSACKTEKYVLNGSQNSIKRVSITDRSRSSIRLSLEKALDKGRRTTLSISEEILDCVGNKMERSVEVPIGIPQTAEAGDVAINEILFDAKVDGAEYIELLNVSDKYINTKGLLLAKSEGGKYSDLQRISELGFLFAPGSYLLLSKYPDKVAQAYSTLDKNTFFAMPDLFSLDDNSAVIALVNDTFGLVDEVSYSAKMHLPTLVNVDGISLERINSSKPTNFPGNWHSAAESVGFGTPGVRNSQSVNDSIAKLAVELKEDVFSPDNDGYNDVLTILYKFDKTGCRATAIVFDCKGRQVKTLFSNFSLGTDGSFSWDGTNTVGKLCDVSPYLIFVRAVFDDGTVQEYRKTCVLSIKR